MLRHLAFILLGCLLTAASGTNGPPAPALPAALPEPHVPAWGGELARGEAWASAFLGVGHLRPAEERPNLGHDWLEEVILPLYRGPDGPHWGWLARGWLVPAGGGAMRPFPADCLVETTYESSSIILSDWGDDGWFRLAVDKPCTGEPVPLWSHRTLLGLGVQRLSVQLWQDFFFGEDVSPLSFRQAEVPHALRAGPSANAARITWIGPAHAMAPLDVVGDWMRVRVTQPSDYCIDPADWQGTEHEGWVRWRDGVKGPWLFVWSRGC